MEKEYNLSKLFGEDEFDVQKGYNRYGTKEAYFSILYRFTLDSGKLLKECDTDKYRNGQLEIGAIIRYADRLQGMLARIGAVNLAWCLQSLDHLIEKMNYAEYVKRLDDVLPSVARLRERIISAEKTESEADRGERPRGVGGAENEAGSAADEKPRAKLRRGGFEKLVMLIDNFELDSAVESAAALTRFSYTPEVDKALSGIYQTLCVFNYADALDSARKLLELVEELEEAANPSKKSILAIDDMPDVLRTVKAMLKNKYNVVGVTSFESAIKFLRSGSADLIMLDIEMPGLDGFAMMQLFRKLPEYAETPVVFLSSNVSAEHISMAMSLGARDFIKKPVDLAVLVEKLEGALHAGDSLA